MNVLSSEPTRAGSPPTDRVVAVIEFLAAHPQPSSVATIAARLELNRSTTTAILGALERASWAQRDPDLKYSLGPGLYVVADALRSRLPLTDHFTSTIDELAQTTSCDASLALIGASTMTFLSVARGHGQAPAGVSIGAHVPLTPPLGVSVIAHRDRDAQLAWLDSAPRGAYDAFDSTLTEVRAAGVAVFGLGDTDLDVLVALTEVTQKLTEHPRRELLQRQAYDLLTSLAGNPYTTEELATTSDLSISYLAAPAFAEGRPIYEIQLGVLRKSVSPHGLAEYIDPLQAAARALSSP